MNEIKSKRGFVLILFVLVAALSRLFPHPPNFTAVGAIALFGGAYFKRKYLAFLIPFLALFISDLFLNNVVYAKMFPDSYEGFVFFREGSIFIYGAFLLIVLLGMTRLKNKIKLKSVFLTSIIASLLFFIITNFGVWAQSIVLYPKTFSGLMACYIAGIPYFWNTLAGDLFFCGVFFGSFEFLKSRSLITAYIKS